MIQAITIVNYKALRHVKLELERLTVLVGSNASGKTSILECLQRACLADQPHYFAARELASFDEVVSRPGDGEITLDCESTGGSWGFTFERVESPTNGPRRYKVWETHRRGTVSNAPRYRSFLSRFEPKKLSAPSYVEVYPATLSEDGSRLATVLAFMAGNRPDVFHWVVQSLRGIVPAISRVRFDRDTVADDAGTSVQVHDVLVFDTPSGHDISARCVSEGTLLVLGILAAIVDLEGPRVLLLDDLDRGLHPKAQEALVAMLRRFLDENEDTQIVATSHSPILLNYLRPQEVRLTAVRQDGSVACGKLTDHPDFEQWKDEMLPGEFWSFVGEQWLAGETVAFESGKS